MNSCYMHGENEFEVRKTRGTLLEGGGGINHDPTKMGTQVPKTPI